MANPIYQSLIELQSLDRHIKQHLDTCEGEQARLVHIEKLRSRKQTLLNELVEKQAQQRLDEQELERRLHEVTHTLTQNRENKKVARTEQQVVALEKEATLFEEQLNEIEAEQFSLLEKFELNLQEINEVKSFLSGSELTLKETEIEVEKACQLEQQEIAGYEKRREALFGEIPQDFRLAFEQALKLHRFRSPLSFITSRRCGQCHFQLDSMQASDVFTASSPQLCNGCKRLLIDREQSQSFSS